MGKIVSVEVDGVQVPDGGTVSLSWAKRHYVTIYYDCEAWWTDCTCKFVVKVDGNVFAQVQDVKVPTEGGGHPVAITIGELKPGSHIVVIEAYEGAPEYGDFVASYIFTANVVAEEEQTEPYDYPIIHGWDVLSMLSDLWNKYWWAFIAGGIIVGALILTPKDESKELEELMKLKIMSELAKEKR